MLLLAAAMLLLCGCGPTTAKETPLSVASDETGGYQACIYQATVSADEIWVIEQDFQTNDTEIKIKNASDAEVTCYLYDPDHEEPIMEMNLDPKQSGAFTNLTAARIYQIGVASETEDVRLSISY